ncbi:hypothetical protein MITS9509_01737 [Synechococcus sp. MIT S9509]|nr:hypothetical protein MITS9504_00362 [Synechococcus sp. MIT S9504]KZR92276.1 hypothetical protein MITS9509_01737 [Synechococcus sp. MIT S9509]
MSLTTEQQCLYRELMNIETDLFYMTTRDCKQLAKGLTRMGIQTPLQLRYWLEDLHTTDA